MGLRTARGSPVHRDEGSPPDQEQQVVWSKSQIDVMRALLRIYHRSRVAGILYAACKHNDYEHAQATVIDPDTVGDL